MRRRSDSSKEDGCVRGAFVKGYLMGVSQRSETNRGECRKSDVKDLAVPG